MANKAELNDYSEKPFFKVDKTYEQGRLIAWSGGAKQQEQLFWTLIEVIGEKIDYLFKEEIDVGTDDTVWRRISGGILSGDLRSAIETDADFFFHDI